MSWIDAGLWLAALPVLMATGYLFVLALLSRRRDPPAGGAPRLKFDLIVPAHDEESGIAGTVESLRAVDYPAALRRVIVVADNCTDGTEACARAAGAEVWVRCDPAKRGKGHALAFAFEASLSDGFADAVVVIDADTVVTPNLLRAVAARIERGAAVVQVGSGISNAGSSWRTSLAALGFALFNGVRSLGRERLGLSCGLRGNGMCFTRSVLLAHPHRACSLVEDVEYGIELGRGGVRVEHAHEAVVSSCMPVTERAARSQRRRWESGRRGLARQKAIPLFAEGVRRRDPLLLDLAVDLLVPPLSQLTVAVALGSVAALVPLFFTGEALTAVWAWGLAAVSLTVYVLRGWQLSGLGWRGLKVLAWIPAYVVWKLTLPLRGSQRTRDEWVRTEREGAKLQMRPR